MYLLDLIRKNVKNVLSERIALNENQCVYQIYDDQ